MSKCSLFLLLFASSMVYAQPDQPVRPPKIVMVDELESYVEELNMGSRQTEFWKRIQTLINKPNLTNFPRIAELLKFDLKGPLDFVDMQTTKAQFKDNLRSTDWFIQSGDYGIGFATNEARQKFIGLRIFFDLKQICISKDEIARAYVNVRDIRPFNYSNIAHHESVGILHGIGLRDHDASFEIAASGCATRLTISKDMTE